MCDTMNPDSVEPSVVNKILSSIIDGMRADRRQDIRLAAVTALNNSLDFTGKNFEIDAERDAIVRAICEATQAGDVKIREKAFECFSSIAELYYERLQPYAETMFQLSLTAISTDDPKVGMAVIELWNTISDQELDIAAEIEDGNADTSDLLKLIQVAAPTLVPLLLQCMTKQEEDADDDDSWNISTAAATLLEGISRNLEDAVVELVLPFVMQNINNTNWRLKEAALMAFGMILDGPSHEKLAPLVVQAMHILITCLGDRTTLVRDTSAWTIARICELHKSCLSGEMLPPMVAGLSAALEDQAPRVVIQACYAVHNLADACNDESEAPSNVLSHFMPSMLAKLLSITVRPDWETDNMRASAYETINAMVVNSAVDMQPIVMQLMNEALNRLEQTFNPQMNGQERMNLQSCLCALVGEIVKKLDTAQAAPFADRIMTLLFKVFEAKGAVAHEDAFMAIGFMIEKMGEAFLRYLPFLQGPLLLGLKSVEEHQLCTVAVGVVGDLCRALGKALLPNCDDIMRCLLELLQSQVLHRSVKPHVISLFADIAMAIEGDFDRYAGVILGILKQAGDVNISSDDEELIEYINTLRQSILEAYTGILQGLKAANKQDTVIPYLEAITEFMHRSAADENRSSDVLKAAVGLLGDLGQTFGSKMLPLYQMPFVPLMIQQAAQADEDIQEIAQWTQTVRHCVRFFPFFLFFDLV
jgi:importin subunit beta-1